MEIFDFQMLSNVLSCYFNPNAFRIEPWKCDNEIVRSYNVGFIGIEKL